MSKKLIVGMCLIAGVGLGVLLGQIGVATAESKADAIIWGTGLEADDYRKIHLEIVNNVQGSFEVSAQELRTKIELQMRAVGLTPTNTRQPGAGTLRVEIARYVIDGKATTGFLNFEYIRTLFYYTEEKSYFKDVAVWGGAIQLGGFNREVILHTFTALRLEPFLNEYLKANQDAS